jgi:hypothetical protein
MSFLVNPYSYATGCTDADAVAFLAAAAITDATITSAICTLVTSMKADGTWAKCNAIYPMVGGTATTHKFNLKNPLDTNAAFRLTFTGGWTHSANGALPNGTNAYADSFFNPSLNASLNSHHISYYSRSNINLSQVDIGCNTTTNATSINARFGNISYFRINATSAINGYISVADTDSRALYISNRTASNVVNGWRNSIKIITGTRASLSLPNINMYLGASNNISIAGFFSTKQCAFATIGTGLTDGEAVSLYNSVQAFQTTLARQV